MDWKCDGKAEICSKKQLYIEKMQIAEIRGNDLKMERLNKINDHRDIKKILSVTQTSTIWTFLFSLSLCQFNHMFKNLNVSLFYGNISEKCFCCDGC